MFAGFPLHGCICSQVSRARLPSPQGSLKAQLLHRLMLAYRGVLRQCPLHIIYPINCISMAASGQHNIEWDDIATYTALPREDSSLPCLSTFPDDANPGVHPFCIETCICEHNAAVQISKLQRSSLQPWTPSPSSLARKAPCTQPLPLATH